MSRSLTLDTGLHEIIAFDQEEARVCASVRALLEKAGTPIGPMDTRIAGTAVCHGAT